jgi:hypothetical protein
MRKLALLTTALIFTGTNLALALPAAPLGATGQGLSSGLDSEILLVRNDKKSKKVKKSSKKSSGGGMNMQNMPPGHKM